MRNELAWIVLLSFALTSCGGAKVSFVSSPIGATISFDGKKAETPAEFAGVKPGTYNVEGKAIGYLPGKMTVEVKDTDHHQFSMVFAKEIEQSVSFNTSIPMDGIRFRAVKEPTKYEFIPYDPTTGQVGKTIHVKGPTEPLFDIKLIRQSSNIPNANVLIKATAEGQACWSDCQPGSDAVCPMSPEPKQPRPNWDYLQLSKVSANIIAPVITNGMQSMDIFRAKVESFESDFEFFASQVGKNTVWSFLDKRGRQKLLFNDGTSTSLLWEGEYGIGGLDYIADKATLAYISDSMIFTVLTTDTGYKLTIMDFSGKVIAQKQVYEFIRDIKVRKYGKNIYGIVMRGKNDRIRTQTFDGSSFLEPPTMDNADFNNTAGIWIPMGSNYELRISENLSVMVIPTKNSKNKHMVVYAGSRN